MNLILLILIASTLLIDFKKIEKNNNQIIYIYISIVILIIMVSLVDNYEILSRSPLEILIEKMQPITGWIEMKLT
ncbi:hypothetical protein [Alkaliphilus peptidifermentans]|uniref:Uncharacterized protein n=1 Tax=Alkaliphilus peptidifermentans DSM 18978 TaxID=1120976 RepID=A0A1G5KNN5_9FIRM|nr:hypothetical protein [Alkaliphilus peptidifermentans]SCZ01720.1 hypothetical protein SAMN03080606_03600 [Alkaliphilus peptidifermentans DSM 18978]